MDPASANSKQGKPEQAPSDSGKVQRQQRKSGACSAATFSIFRFWPVTAPQSAQERQDKP